MVGTVERARHDATLQMRMSQQTKALIESAAALSDKTVSAFVTDSARQSAIDVVLDRTVFALSPEQTEAFARMLDAPPTPSAKLRELMRGESPWDR